MNEMLRTSWSGAWSGLEALGDGGDVRDALVAQYEEAERRYHTPQHLEECLLLFDRMKAAPDHPSEVEMALWFHDAVYEIRGGDNEERSATWAFDALLQNGGDGAIVARVRELVLATRHKALPRTLDEQVLVDVDLAILGAPPERFAEYERQIRDEYTYAPGFLFRMKRREILRSFLDRPAIFSRPELHRELEQQARANLQSAIV